MHSSLRAQLEAGKTVTGMLLFTGSPMVVEMMAAAGLDFVIIDMEHSALDLDRAAHLIRVKFRVRIPAAREQCLLESVCHGLDHR